MSLAIGIDLGTCYSSVGVFRNGQFEAIPNEGSFMTPSFVAFTETGRLIGGRAKSQLALNPCNTVFDAQRLLGRRFNDEEVQANIKHFPFKVLDRRNKPFVEVQYKGEANLLTPVQVISMILAKMKEVAEKYLGYSICEAVITCPNCWNSSKRQSIRDAALIAGLTHIQIISSPSCAALAYNIDKYIEGERNVLVFDLGGDTCNTTLAEIYQGFLEIKSVACYDYLGGENFNNRLVNHFVDEFKRRYNRDISTSIRSLCRLRSACEQAKCVLSSSTTANIDIEHLFEGIDFNTMITRARFEELCQDLFRSTLSLVDRVLADGKLDKGRVHEIILVGGSTRIPKIQRLITEYFNGKELSKSVSCDLAACYGAAAQAAKSSDPTLSEFLLMDAPPVSLGIEEREGVMCPIIFRNSTIPIKRSKTFASAYNDQSDVSICALPICVYEGERRLVKENNLLGTIELTDFLPPSAVPHVEITFDVDFYNILAVSVRDLNSGKLMKSFIPANGSLSKGEIDYMIAQAEKYKEDDVAEAARLSAKTAFESRIYSLKKTIDKLKSIQEFKLSEINNLESQTDQFLTWLDENAFKGIDEYEFQQKGLAAVESVARMKLDEARDGEASNPSVAPST